MVTAMASLDAKRPYGFRLASGTLRARHAADSEAAVSLGNMCRSILYELLAVLSPNLAAVLPRSEEHTSELQSHLNLVCRLLLEKKKNFNHISAYGTQ